MTARKIAAPGITVGRLPMWAAIAALLLLPAIAMQFTTQVAWDKADFAAAALLLLGAGAAFEIGSRMTADPKYRAIMGITIGIAVLVIWADAAVGIF